MCSSASSGSVAFQVVVLPKTPSQLSLFIMPPLASLHHLTTSCVLKTHKSVSSPNPSLVPIGNVHLAILATVTQQVTYSPYVHRQIDVPPNWFFFLPY